MQGERIRTRNRFLEYCSIMHDCKTCVYAPECIREAQKKVRRFKKRMESIVQQAQEQGVSVSIESDGTGINMLFQVAGAIESAAILKYE